MNLRFIIFSFLFLFINNTNGQEANKDKSLCSATRLTITFDGQPVHDSIFRVEIDNNFGVHLQTDEHGTTTFILLQPGQHNCLVKSKVYGTLNIKNIPIIYGRNTYIDVDFNKDTQKNKSKIFDVDYKMTRYIDKD